MESLNEKDREQVLSVRDAQLERAVDLLKGIVLYTQRSPAAPPDKQLAKTQKRAEAK